LTRERLIDISAGDDVHKNLRHEGREGVFASLQEDQSGEQHRLVRWLKRTIRGERGPRELQQVIDESEEKGLIDHEEGDMIEGIFELKQTVAREIMIPRTSIVAVPKDCSLDQLLTIIIDSGHSRIPVFDENVDHIVGILNAKDLLPFWRDNKTEIPTGDICRDPYFVPETKRINDLLNELRAKKSHLAVIVDEYGGTSGIVTIEDIIEEIIGEIRDEHDMEEELFVDQDERSTIVNAIVNLDDFEERFEVTLPREGYDTLGGYIIHLLGRVPKRGEELASVSGLHLQIQGADPKRITRVLVTRTTSEDTEDKGRPSGYDS